MPVATWRQSELPDSARGPAGPPPAVAETGATSARTASRRTAGNARAVRRRPSRVDLDRLGAVDLRPAVAELVAAVLAPAEEASGGDASAGVGAACGHRDPVRGPATHRYPGRLGEMSGVPLPS